MKEGDKTSYRLVRVIGLLLILQVIVLVSIGIYEITSLDWVQIGSGQYELQYEALDDQTVEALIFLSFLPPAVIMLLVGLSFLLLKRRGWLLAAISQGLTLGICLSMYVDEELSSPPAYIYPIMVYCILMILYLNSQEVRVIFHSRRVSEKQGAEAVDES